MNWQVKYALENLTKDRDVSAAEHVSGDVIKISTANQPDVLAAISDAETIDEAVATHYHKGEPALDFLCGYRKSCVWEGSAIAYLERNRIGWGNFGTLCSAIGDGEANSSAHKVYAFADRIYHQTRLVQNVEREFDRVHTVTLRNGRNLRIGMIAEYEPAADAVRSLWQRFGPVDVVWNINPNGNPTKNAIEAGKDLGCEVLKWEGLKALMQKA